MAEFPARADAAPSQPLIYRLALWPGYALMGIVMFGLTLFAILTDDTLTPPDMLLLTLMSQAGALLFAFAITRPVAVALCEQGIYPGNPRRRMNQLIPWGDIAAASARRFLFFRYLQLQVRGRFEIVWIPLSLADSQAFSRDILRLAPADGAVGLCLRSGGAPRQIDLPAQDGVSPSSAAPALGGSGATGMAAPPIASTPPWTRLRSSAGWLYWIAGLSAANTLAVLLGWDFSFVIGLGTTQFVDAFAQALAEELSQIAAFVWAVAIAADIVIAGIFALLGIFAHKACRWAFITAIVLYALDTVLVALGGDWFSVAFHAIALWSLIRGLRLAPQLRKTRHAQPVSTMQSPGL